jgi:superfamily I DNA and/or RNA helicase
MAERTVRAGFIVYTDASGRPVTGYLGDEVDVHEDDLERFDRLNPEEPAREDVVPDEFDEDDEEEPYEGVKVADLKSEIEKRNEDREDADKISPAEPGNRPELVAALVADDKKQS